MDWLGTIGYKTEVDTSGVSAGTERAEREVRESMRRIDGMNATAKAELDLKKLELDVVEVKKTLRYIDSQTVDIDVDIDDTKFAAAKKRLQAELKDLNQTKLEIGTDLRHMKAARREADNITAAEERRRRAVAKVAAEEEKVTDGLRKQQAEVAKLRYQYAKVTEEIRKLEKAGRPAGARSSKIELARLAVLRQEHEKLAASIRHVGGATEDLDGDLNEHNGLLRRWSSSLANVRVHMGVASLTIKQFGIATLALGPIIEGMIGGASALVGVLGSGIVGAGALGGAAISGFALTLGGALGIIVPLVKEIGTAREAIGAYDDAVMKYGKHSDEAKDAQKEMNRVMGNVPAETRKAVEGIGALGDQWRKLTAGARKPFFETLGEGVKTAKALLPSFAREATRSFSTIAGETQEWLRGLRSPEAQQIMTNLMSNFRASIGPAMEGLGDLGTALARVFSVASNHLPGVARTFENWASSIEQSTRNSGDLASGVGDVIDKARSVGAMFTAAARTARTFFSLGSDSGQGMVDTFTNTLNRWNAFMRSTEGANSMRDWFDESASTTQSFLSVLQRAGDILFQISRITAPIVGQFLRLVTVIGDVVSALMSFGPTAAVLRTVGSILVSYFVASRFLTLASAIGKAATAMGLFGAASRTALAGSAGAAAAGGAAATLTRTGAAAKTAAGNFTLYGSQGAVAMRTVGTGAATTAKPIGMLSKMGAGLAGFMGGPLLGALTLAGAAFLTFGQQGAEAQARIDGAVAEMEAATGAAQAQRGALNQVGLAWGGVGQAVKQGGRQLKIVAAQMRATLDPAKADLANLRQANTNTWNSVRENLTNGVKDAVGSLHPMFDIFEELGHGDWQSGVDRVIDGIGKSGRLTEAWKDKLLDMGAGYDDIARIQGAISNNLTPKYLEGLREANKLADALALRQMNVRRSLEGLQRLPGKIAGDVAKLQRRLGSRVVQQAFLKFDDREATTKIANLSSKLSDLGHGKEVKQVLINSKGEDQALQALRAIAAVDLRQKTLQLQENGGFKVLGVLAKIMGWKLPDKTQRLSESGGGGVLGMIADIVRKAIPSKTATIRGNPSPALAAIGAVISGLARIHDKTVTVTTVNASLNRGRAGGGPIVPSDAALERAGRRAAGMAGTGGRYAQPTYIVGEENRPEYVIATNPAYRAQNLDYLDMAAAALGREMVPGYKKGGKPGKHPNKGNGGGGNKPGANKPGKGDKPDKPSNHPPPAPSPYATGGIEENVAQEEFDKAKTAYDNEKRKKKDLEQRIKQERKEKHPNRGKINKLQGDLKNLKVAKKKAQFEAAQKRLGDVKGINATWADLENQIETQASNMDAAESLGNQSAWTTARDEEVGLIDRLVALLRPAEKDAVNKVYKSELGSRIAQLLATRAGISGIQAPEAPGLDFDDWLKGLGLSGERAKLEADFAVAGVTPGEEDDEAARAALQGFWGGVLNRATSLGNQEFIAAAANEMANYLPDSASGSGSPTVAEQTVTANQQRWDLLTGFGGNVAKLSTAFANSESLGRMAPGTTLESIASGGPGVLGPDIMAPSDSGQPGRVFNQTNNFAAPPPDPHTWTTSSAFEAQAGLA